ncbi:hypothetical protein J5N97_004136 [Dioscorea zingiberensis]|uniref:Uncharacterized protein n=1 Tax=Dioscorea zingiberensis TaxID=325984 RepID=A0A9D5D820_9LILI|nr:hypothetical protein J5N97_004136 [Dioscorea zingiberensis]
MLSRTFKALGRKVGNEISLRITTLFLAASRLCELAVTSVAPPVLGYEKGLGRFWQKSGFGLKEITRKLNQEER